MMIRLDVLRNFASVAEFAEGFFAIADCECLDSIPAHLTRDRRDCAGIESSAEKYTERHVAHQVRVHRTFEQFTVSLDVILSRLRCPINTGRQVPITVDCRFALFRHYENVSPHELSNSGEHGFRSVNISERKILAQRFSTER